LSEPHPETPSHSPTDRTFFTLSWQGDVDGSLLLLDQTRLPHTETILELQSPEEVIEAIVRLSVRGAPAIGVAGAYALCLATRGLSDRSQVIQKLRTIAPSVRECRPTAVNLATMVDRMMEGLDHPEAESLDGMGLRSRLLDLARGIETEDQDYCTRIGASGADLIPEGSTVLTHCNAGALATAGSGTALSVIYAAWESGRRFSVVADETRPLLQGSRITAWELQKKGIPVQVICDGAAGSYFQRDKIDLVITGADRIAANGDAANKIGTYMLATLAAAHDIPFYIAAPSSTFDFGTENGQQIPIEERDEKEIWYPLGEDRPQGEARYGNPAFDITPAPMIRGWITEEGILQPPFSEIRP
jgi:methylthioribose-1-phosphate isomerase